MFSLLLGVTGQFLNLLLMASAIATIGVGLGLAIRAAALRFAFGPLGGFESWFLGLFAALLASAFLGLMGFRPSRIAWVLLSASLVICLIWAVRTKPNFSDIRIRAKDLVRRNHAGLIGAVLLMVPFLPLFRFGPTTWTLESNDFTLFSSWLIVWESPSHEDFLHQHPDKWGRETLVGATIEKPVAIGALGLLAAFSFGSILESQTAVFLIVVTGTYVFLWKACQALVAEFRCGHRLGLPFAL